MFVFIPCNVYTETVLTKDSLQGERSEEDTNSSTAREQTIFLIQLISGTC